MAFKEDLEKAVEKIEDATLKAEILNEIDQAHALDVGGLKENSEKLKKEKLDIQAKLEAKEADLGTFKGLEGKTLADFQAQEKVIADLMAEPGDKAEKIIAEKEKAIQLQLTNKEQAFAASLLLKDADIAERELKIESLNQEMNDELCQRELVTALERVNVKQELKPMLAKALRDDVSVDTDEAGKRIVKFKHKGVKFDIMDGIGTWAGDKSNNSFIGAIRNAGAGATGSGGIGSGIDKPFSELTYPEEVAYFKRDPEGYRQAKANAGK